MDKLNFLEALQQRIDALLAATPAADVQKNLKALLTQQFARLELATREEFDTQRRVLARSREKLEALENRVAALESNQSPTQESSRGSGHTSRRASGRETARK